MSDKKSSGAGRTRNFATVVYPSEEWYKKNCPDGPYDGSDGWGSAPDNWRDILAEMRIPCFISPLHDKDVNPKDGKPKKPHWHVQACYDSVKTDEQARDNFEQFGGVGLERVNSLRGYARYLCHLDNPDKAAYNTEDVISLCGLDYHSIIGTSADKAKYMREMMAWINEEDCTCWADLMDYASIHRSDWFDALNTNCAYATKEYIKSRTWKLHHQEEK